MTGSGPMKKRDIKLKYNKCNIVHNVGEEDMHAYDLSRLQKPVYPDVAVMSAAQPGGYTVSPDDVALVGSGKKVTR